jgi:hypothetical protein
VHGDTIVTKLGFNDTWTAEGSPYQIVNTLTVPVNGTLTILAGVTAEFTCGVFINAYAANIIALGNSTHPIVLTSIRSPINCRWGGILMTRLTTTSVPGGVVILQGITFANVGLESSYVLNIQQNTGSQIYANISGLTFEQNIMRDHTLINVEVYSLNMTNSTFNPGTFC